MAVEQKISSRVFHKSNLKTKLNPRPPAGVFVAHPPSTPPLFSIIEYTNDHAVIRRNSHPVWPGRLHW